MAKSLIKTVFDSAFSGAMKWYYERNAKPVGEPSASPDARYESAYQYWHKRGYVPAAIQDARFDANGSTRRELMRRSRHWEQNTAVLQRLLDLFEEFTVGPHGLHLVSNSSSDDWNSAATAWYKEWSKHPARDNYQHLSSLQSLMARSWFVDGEIFVLKTFDPDTRLPALQLIEAHVIETPGSMSHLEGQSIVDGVEIDGAGKPIAYWVRQADTSAAYGYNLQVPGGTPGLNNGSSQNYRRVVAANMLHLFEPVRAGLTRGLPMAYAVLNDVQDLYEIQDLEMQVSRDAARVTSVMTTKTGEANVSNAIRNKWAVGSQDANGNATTKNIPQYYEVTMGGETVYVMNGEKFEQFRSSRPSAETQALYDIMVNKICIGVGIPKLLVIPYSMQGTVARADLSAAASYFKARFEIIGFLMKQLYEWVMGWAKDWVPALKGAPADWSEVIVRPPRSVDVDVGRNSAAIIAEMDAGIRPMADVCNELGLDWKQVLTQRAKEAAYINSLATEYNVPREQIAEPPKPPVPPAPPSGGGDEGASANGFKTNGHNHSRLKLV